MVGIREIRRGKETGNCNRVRRKEGVCFAYTFFVLLKLSVKSSARKRGQREEGEGSGKIK